MDIKAGEAPGLLKNISISGAVILLCIYVAGLVFSMRTHKFLFMPVDEEDHQADWSMRTAIVMLLVATGAVAYLSEAFVGAIEFMNEHKSIDMSEMFRRDRRCGRRKRRRGHGGRVGGPQE